MGPPQCSPAGEDWDAPEAEIPPEASWPLADLPDATMKRLFKVVYSAVLAAATIVTGLFVLKMTREFDRVEDTRPVGIVTTMIAAIDVALLGGCAVAFGWRVRSAMRAGLAWGRRRWRRTGLFCAQLACVFMGNLFFLVPNLYAATVRCGYFAHLHNYSGMIRWTALNTLLALLVVEARTFVLTVDGLGHPLGGDEHASWLDGPWHAHWFVGLYWLFFEACVLSFVVFLSDGEQSSCSEGPSPCAPGRVVWTVTSNLMVMCFGYLLMYLCFMRCAFVRLSKKSYLQHRWANVSVRFSFRMVGIVMLFGVLSISLLWFSRPSSCLSYVIANYGFVPLQLSLTFLMVANTVVSMPARPGTKAPTRGVLSSNLIWLERETRDQELAAPAGASASNPHFCFEIAIKLVYWCEFIYEYNDDTGEATAPFALDTAMELFAFTHFEYITSKRMDAHGMIAWNDSGTILLCFRGTYSAANVVADLEVWRVPHPPLRGHLWLGTRPLVHKGFLATWECEGFKEKVLTRVKGILDGDGLDKSHLRVLVSGHSLGGAMAVLAANDIRRRCEVAAEQLSCYTFGCPHVGNRPFAEEHDKDVPNTWHVVNDVDPVARMGKFFSMFKRSGRRVLVNGLGDMIVLPVFLEFKMTSAFMGDRRVKHHLLSSYRKSLSAVVLSQFHKYKALPGGEGAMRILLDEGDVATVLGVSSKSASKLVVMGSSVWSRT